MLSGARILWIDDEPQNNFHEHRLFQRAGATIDSVVSNDEAVEFAQRHPYDVVISDWARSDDPEAGSHVVDRLRAVRVRTPVIFYVGRVEGRAHDGFAMTALPDQLIRHVLDALHEQH